MGRGGRLLTFREAPSLLFACWEASTRGTKRWFCRFPKGWAHHCPQQHPPRRQRRSFGLDLRIFLSLVITAFGNGWSPGWLHKLPGMSPPLRVPSCVVAEFSSSRPPIAQSRPYFPAHWKAIRVQLAYWGRKCDLWEITDHATSTAPLTHRPPPSPLRSSPSHQLCLEQGLC